jgi:polysaccharide deacetylase family protein (PEP-CTERM system associated)
VRETVEAEDRVRRSPLVNAPLVNAMTVDVEDYFQVQAFADVIPRDTWDNFPRRVERNTERLLEIFSEGDVKATFFALGWITERHPALIRRIAEAGHELASHGYSHVRADTQTPKDFRADVIKAKSILEDASGAAVRGYRAATFSIGRDNWWAFEILAEAGYTYSSSTHPIAHDLYGMPNGSRSAFRVAGGKIAEIPISTTRLFGQNLPCGGGGYFRALPYRASRWALKRINATDRLPCVFYLHPWEIDPTQPRQGSARLKSRMRHYLNLGATEGRLKRLLADFSWARMDQVFSDVIEP